MNSTALGFELANLLAADRETSQVRLESNGTAPDAQGPPAGNTVAPQEPDVIAQELPGPSSQGEVAMVLKQKASKDSVAERPAKRARRDTVDPALLVPPSGVSQRSRRTIIPKLVGTAAYDAISAHQDAALKKGREQRRKAKGHSK